MRTTSRNRFHRLSTLLLLASIVCFLTGSSTNDYTVTGVGWFFCYDGTTNTTVPLAGARVQLMDSDCDGSTICDDVMGSSHVQADGHFAVTGRGGDPGDYSWSHPDVYIRVLYNDDQGVRLTDELDDDRWADTPEHDHDNTTADMVDFGSWATGEGVGIGNASQCGVWLAAHRTYQDYLALMGQAPPPAGHWDVEYWSGVWAGTPWTNDNTTHWPIHYPSSAATHEFGHSIRHAADGDRNHFNWDAIRFRYARYHNICDQNSNRIPSDTHEMGLAYGFNEGWAEFWEGRTWGCWAITIDDESEGNNAYALANLAAYPGVGKPGMVQVLRDHPGQIHSLDEFIQFFAQQTRMSSSALMQGIKANHRQVSAPPAKQWPPILGDTFLRSILVREMAEVRDSIQSAQRSLDAAVYSARHLPPCLPLDCDEAFRALVRPPMLRASLEARRVYLDRLNRIGKADFRERYLSMLSTGGLDRFLSQLRASDLSRLQHVYSQGFQEALRAARQLAVQSPAAALEWTDLAHKSELVRFQPVGRRNFPPGLASEFSFSEDRPVRYEARDR